jgi:hypothetical protein
MLLCLSFKKENATHAAHPSSTAESVLRRHHEEARSSSPLSTNLNQLEPRRWKLELGTATKFNQLHPWYWRRRAGAEVVSV